MGSWFSLNIKALRTVHSEIAAFVTTENEHELTLNHMEYVHWRV